MTQLKSAALILFLLTFILLVAWVVTLAIERAWLAWQVLK